MKKTLLSLKSLLIATVAITISQTTMAQIGSPVTINVTPTATASGLTDQTYCSGSVAAAQSFTGSTGADSFVISGGSTVGLIDQTVTTAEIPSFTAATSTTTAITATVTVTAYDNGCTGADSTFVITIPPVPTATAPNDTTICGGLSVSAIAFTGTADSFVISGGSAVGITDQTVTTAEIPAFVASTTTGVATVTITPYANGCAGSDVTFDVTIPAAATATAPSDITACAGATVAATSFTGTADSFVISGGSAAGLTDQTVTTAEIPSFIASTTAGTTTVTITPYSGACEGTAVTFDIVINPLPAGSITPVDADLCVGESAYMEFNATAGTGPFNIEYQVTTTTPVTNITASSLDDGDTIMTYAPDATNSYQLMKITDANGCILE